jgi:ribonucleoside-diphosphate reductase alpha subunit
MFKRNTTHQPFSASKLTKNLLELAARGGIPIGSDEIGRFVDEVARNLPESPTSGDLVEIATRMANAGTFVNPEFERLATFIYMARWHKMTPVTFSKAVEEIQHETLRIWPIGFSFVMKHAKAIDGMICNVRDYDFDYLGLSTLENQGYIIKNRRGEKLERPQYVYMRYAVTIGICTGMASGWDDVAILDHIRTIYDLTSKKLMGAATPGLFNGLLDGFQFLSCFIFGSGDSIDGICKMNTSVAKISKMNGGIGVHLSTIRSAKSLIKGTGSHTVSVVKHGRVLNEMIQVWKQSEKRRGALSLWLEVWHADIIDFIGMKTVGGDEEMKCRSIFPGLWLNNDLFLKRVEDGGKWSLFSESDAPGLSDVYGDDFQALYEEYEHMGRARKSMPARDLFDQIAAAIASVSGMYVCMKDNVNRKSNQVKPGSKIIKSSNLCCEIMEISDGENIASCNLCAVLLSNYVKNGAFDFAGLYENVKVCISMLDTVVDCNNYPDPACVPIAKAFRPVACGLMGLAEVFIKMGFPYLSPEAEQLDRQIMETIYYAALESSAELAQVRGSYPEFEGSKYSRGILQFDDWAKDLGDLAKPSDMYDWDALRIKVKAGMRNSLLVALMPTVSTSQIAGQSESFEPIKSCFSLKLTGHGKYPEINTLLVREFIRLGIWDDEMRYAITEGRGSVQGIDRIPEKVREVYRTIWEMSPYELMRRNAIRSTMVDQSTSYNVYCDHITPNFVKAIIMQANKFGLKTALYYVKIKPTVAAINNLNKPPPSKKPTKMICTDEICTSCAV